MLAAEISVESPDFGHLEPIVDATVSELERAGVAEKPKVAVADAGYWHQEQMDSLAAAGIHVVIPPDAGKRKGARPGWQGGHRNRGIRSRAFTAGAQDELDVRRAPRPRRGCRSTRPTTVAAASSPPRLQPRPPPRSGGARRPQSAVGGALPALARERHGRSRSSRSTPTRPTAKRSTNELPWAWIVGDHFHLVRGANSAVDSVRRARQREAGSRRPKGARRSGQWARWRPELYAAATACSMPGTTTRAAAALSTVRARSRGSRGVGAQGGLRQVHRAPDRYDATPTLALGSRHGARERPRDVPINCGGWMPRGPESQASLPARRTSVTQNGKLSS